jgi:hypothetical protein
LKREKRGEKEKISSELHHAGVGYMRLTIVKGMKRHIKHRIRM